MNGISLVTGYVNSIVYPQSIEGQLLRKRFIFVIFTTTLTTGLLYHLGLFTTAALVLFAAQGALGAVYLNYLITSDPEFKKISSNRSLA